MLIAPSSTAFNILDLLADATNPLLGIALIVGLVLLWRQNRGRFWSILIATIASIALLYLIKTIDGRYDIWASIGLNYSTHSALAIALGTALSFARKQSWWIFLSLFIAYAALMLLLRFHTLADILTTSIVIFPVCLTCHFLARNPKAAMPV